MTVNKRFLAGPNDILAMRLTCKNCHSTLSLRVNGAATRAQDIHSRCAVCNQDWLADREKAVLTNLLLLLSETQQHDAYPNCKIELEYEQPS